MSPPHFFPKLIVACKILGKPKILIQSNIKLTSFWDSGLIRLHWAVPPSKQCPQMLCWWRWRKWPLEESQRGWIHTGIGRWILECIEQRTRAVKGEPWSFPSMVTQCMLILTGDYWVSREVLGRFKWFPMTNPHWIRNTNCAKTQSPKAKQIKKLWAFLIVPKK